MVASAQDELLPARAGGKAALAGFFPAVAELRPYVEFGFVLPHYRRRGDEVVRRVPTPRATIYFATDVTSGSSPRPVSGLFCEGPYSSVFNVTSESRQLVAVKVSAGGLRALLGVPARELRNSTIPLDQVWGKPAALCAERMLAARSIRERVRLLQEELVGRCRACDRHDRVALAVSKVIDERAGRVQVKELCRLSGYGQRALLQQFDDWVGLTPKQYARLARLRSAIARIGEQRGSGWAELALSCGFCDQSHMINEFQDLIGLSPADFYRQQHLFSPRGTPAFGRSALPRDEQQIYHALGIVSEWVEPG